MRRDAHQIPQLRFDKPEAFSGGSAKVLIHPRLGGMQLSDMNIPAKLFANRVGVRMVDLGVRCVGNLLSGQQFPVNLHNPAGHLLHGELTA